VEVLAAGGGAGRAVSIVRVRVHVLACDPGCRSVDSVASRPAATGRAAGDLPDSGPIRPLCVN
ncbi:MAG: hypothetical protein ACK462_11470, partial [Planctomyces sp.]|jgi:hypothetical protein